MRRQYAGVDSLGRMTLHWGGTRHRVKLGADPAAVALMLQLCALSREQEQEELAERRRKEAEDQRIDARVRDYCTQVDALVRAELQALGYHRPQRRAWRVKRGDDGRGQKVQPAGEASHEGQGRG